MVPTFERVNIIDVPITATNKKECLSSITEYLNDLRGEYICVSNVHTCVMAHDNPIYWNIQAESAMSLPDGKPLSVLGRRKVPSMGRVTGPDLMREILSISASRGWRHYFYGNDPKNLAILHERLLRDYPNVEIAGIEPSVFRPLSPEEEVELVARINASGADFVWIALGAPRQEMLCSRLRGEVEALMIGVGGAFNILAGVIPEAPQWMQEVGLEWLYRLIQEPRRLFRRYLTTNAKFLFYQLAHAPRKE